MFMFYFSVQYILNFFFTQISTNFLFKNVIKVPYYFSSNKIYISRQVIKKKHAIFSFIYLKTGFHDLNSLCIIVIYFQFRYSDLLKTI